MEGNQNVERYKNCKHYKDGESRDKRGRWAGKVVTVRKEYYALIEEWQKRTGLPKAQFWRQAVMIGALELAQSHGIEASFPPVVVVENPEYAKPKKKGKSWLFFKNVLSGK